MGLFSKNKDKTEQLQTNEVKSATLPTINQTESSSAIPTPMPNATVPEPNMAQTPMPQTSADVQNLTNSNQQFNNPFAQQQQMPSTAEPMQMQQSMQSSNELNLGQVPEPTLAQTPMPQTQNQTVEQNSFENELNSLNQATQSGFDEYKIQEMIDETVEKLIEEKWEKIVNNVESVVKWKEKQQQQMNLIKQDIVDMRENLEKIEQKILNKISSYDKNILDVNSEIKALEKVFQKITPTLVNNVNELANIADELKSLKQGSSKKEDFDN